MKSRFLLLSGLAFTLQSSPSQSQSQPLPLPTTQPQNTTQSQNSGNFTSSSINSGQTILQNIFAQSGLSIVATLLSLPRFINITNALHNPFSNSTVFVPTNAGLQESGLFNSSMVNGNETLAGLVKSAMEYSILNGSQIIPVQQNQSSSTNFTLAVFNTTLTNSSIVFLGEGRPQVIITNSSSSGIFVRHGGPMPSKVLLANGTTLNGLLNIVDHPLLPPRNISKALAWNNCTQFSDALNRTGLLREVEEMKGVTVFALKNSGFASLTSSYVNSTSSSSTTSSSSISSTVSSSSILTATSPTSTVNATSSPTQTQCNASPTSTCGQSSSIPIFQLRLLLLRYISVSGVAYSPFLTPTNATIIRPLGNCSSNFTVTGSASAGDLAVNGAKIVVPDVLVANGVVHILDTPFNSTNSQTQSTGN